MSLYFSGFTPAALQFLEDLAKNNTREWFAEHKPDYEHLLKNPSLGLVDVMNERFEDLGLAFVSTPKASLFRIHRDTRFSKDKSPYKTNCGISFPYHARRQDTTAVNSPGLYLHIAPQELFVAGGLYMPMPEQLKAIRERIADEWQILESILRQPMFMAEFPSGLHGEMLKNIPRGYEKDHPGEQYLRLKQYLVECPLRPEAIFTEQIIDIIEAKSIAIAPLLQYLTEAISA